MVISYIHPEKYLNHADAGGFVNGRSCYFCVQVTHFPSSFVTPCFSQLHRAASMIISIVGPDSSCVRGTQLLLKFQISVNLTQVPGSISTPHFIPSYYCENTICPIDAADCANFNTGWTGSLSLSFFAHFWYPGGAIPQKYHGFQQFFTICRRQGREQICLKTWGARGDSILHNYRSKKYVTSYQKPSWAFKNNVRRGIHVASYFKHIWWSMTLHASFSKAPKSFSKRGWTVIC